MSTAVLAATTTGPAVPAVPLKNEAMPAEGTPAAVQQKDVDAADSAACVVESTTTTSAAAPAHKIQRWERTLAATTEAPLGGFAKLVRWRRLGKNLVFLDVVRTGRDDEWQLACAAATFPGGERADVVVVGGEGRARVFATRPPALRCDALAVLTERPSAEKPPKNPDTREKKGVLCKVWARGDTCTTKNCPYRHAFRDAFEETWGRRLRSRRDHDLKQDEQDQHAAYDKHANRNAWRFVPGDDNRKRRHAARHVEFGAWIVDRFGRSLLEAGPVLDVAGGRGQLAWELQCVHGLRAVSLDPRKAKVPRKSRRKLLRKRLAALTPDSSPRDQLMARNPRRVEALLDAAFEASEQRWHSAIGMLEMLVSAIDRALKQ